MQNEHYINEKRIAAWALLHNVDEISVTFCGSGDSGQIDSIYAASNGESVPLGDEIMAFKSGVTVWDAEEGCWSKTVIEEVSMPVCQVLEQLVYAYLEDSHVDWYNNDGGQGSWTWSAKNGLARMYVDVNVVDQVTEFSFEKALGADLDTKDE